jgi:hypothetical protein
VTDTRFTLGQRIAAFTYRTLVWGRDHVPPGIRSLLGVMFMIGGVFGFLPILGFWMFPLGIAFVALDLPFGQHKIEDWMESLRSKAGPAIPPRPRVLDPAPADENTP